MFECVLLFCALMAPMAQEPSPVGTWKGELETGSRTLVLQYRVSPVDGGFKAVMDSPEQQVMGVPADIEILENGVRFSVKSAQVAVTVYFNEAGDVLEGTFRQGPQERPFALNRIDAADPKIGDQGYKADSALAEKAVGYWQGKLDVGGMSLRLAFNIKQIDSGALTVSLDSLDQGVKDLPAKIDQLDKELVITAPTVGGNYTGTFNSDYTQVTGSWKQGPQDLPLTLEKQVGEAADNRPQEPKGPLPYKVEDVTFPNTKEGFHLAGTLTLPEGDGPFAVAVLVTGSGPQNRDEELMGHKPFLVIADHLTRAGIAVLRYDDRGTASSGGNFAAATTLDFVEDVLSAVAFLKTRPEIRKDAMGIVGHSEGGLIAPIAANRSSDVAWIVSLAGPAVSGRAIIEMQSPLLLRAGGLSEELIELNSGITTALMDVIVETDLDEDITEKLRTVGMAHVAKLTPEQRTALEVETDEALDANLARLSTDWFRYFVTYDPFEDLTKVAVPTLVLYGELDLQVPPDQSEPVMRKAFDSAGKKNYEIVVYPKLNHLFQTAETGSTAEYSRIEETFAPVALDKIRSWILAQTK